MQSFRDRIQSLGDRLELDKPSLIKIGMAVGISVCIMLIVFFTQGIPRGEYNASMTRMEQGITTMGSQIADNTADITGLASDAATTAEQYSDIANTVIGHTGDISTLDDRIDTAEGNITTLEATLAAEGYLTGMVGNYILHAKAGTAGNYTANVHLVFSPPISAGNATTYDEAMAAFYGSVNWTAANVKAYTLVASYNGTAWGISQAWWNISTFALVAGTDTDITVLFAGLANTPSFAYAEIYPVLTP